MIIEILESMRPRQWTKNLFVFAGIIFSQNLLCFPLLLKSLFAFLIFCILSGAVYILNDITDLKEDKDHPLKSKRPIASGRLKVSYALGVVTFFLFFGRPCLFYPSTGVFFLFKTSRYY